MDLKKDYIEFQSEISRRGIEYLIHFTPTINLYSILEQGKLMSRRVLENLDIEQLHVNENNYLQIIKDEISNNIIEIYKNHEIKPLTFTDNMYGDAKRYTELMEAKEFKKKNSSVIK